MAGEFDQTGYSETVQRRPEYIEAREKALLDAIMGTQGADGFTGRYGQSLST